MIRGFAKIPSWRKKLFTVRYETLIHRCAAENLLFLYGSTSIFEAETLPKKKTVREPLFSPFLNTPGI